MTTIGWMLGALVTALLLASANSAEQRCERLKATLTYTQEKAPRDLSGLLPVVVEKVNRVLDGVVDVEVEWTGADLHGHVGEHIVECKVTRLATVLAKEQLTEVSVDDEGREVTTQCFHVPFTVLDTNECTLSETHPLRHQCQAPSVCVNTIGSYECLCPKLDDSKERQELSKSATPNDSFWQGFTSSLATRNPWELSFNSTRSSCPSHGSTRDCCPAKAHSSEGKDCRRRFRCPVDPCGSNQNDCAPSALCVRAESPQALPNHKCECQKGLMGNGKVCRPGIDAQPEPKVTFDGVTATELTIKNNYYCGCTKPTVDACSGFPPCKGKHEVCTASAGKPTCTCKPGYVMHEEYGCVDINPPTLKLRNDPEGDHTLRLKQGDEYREYMVDIIDDNAEDYLRSLKISYSSPLPPGCLTMIGEFHVNYTVAMPWATPPFVRITRNVIIEDIDECTLDVSKYKQSCPSLVPQCDIAAGATCVNTIGSYACACPSYTSGDGFLNSSAFSATRAPEGYKGGTSCTDTSKPIISLLGPNPKSFQTCECGGLSGIMGESPSSRDGGNHELQASQRMLYGGDLQEMIRASAGAELCATHSTNHPTPRECVKAVDRTYKGEVDLSERVVVGDPVQKSPLHWVVPYDVTDDAGNVASTMWRDVIVQEVDIAEVESKIRDEVLRQRRLETEKAIEKAVKEEKIKWERKQEPVTGRSPRNRKQECPPCPKCASCSSDATLSKEACEPYCSGSSPGTCSWSEQSQAVAIVMWLEDLIPPGLVTVVIVVSLAVAGLMVLRLMVAIFSPRSFQSYDYGAYGDLREGDRLFQDANGAPAPQQYQSPHATPLPPRQSIVHEQNGAAFFSPAASQAGFGSPPLNNGINVGQPDSAIRHQPRYDESIYESPPLITPSRTGDGVRRRTPQGFM